MRKQKKGALYKSWKSDITDIKDYLIIGDLHTAALVSNKGSIDWLCLPHFDSPSIFAKNLDNEKGGEFSIIAHGYENTARYIPETAIVENIFRSKNDSSFILKDFMLPLPVEKANSHFIVRKITSVKGQHVIQFFYNPQPHYAELQPEIEEKTNSLDLETEEGTLILHLPNDATIIKQRRGFLISVKIIEKQTINFTLEYYKKIKRNYRKTDLEEKTVIFWKNWINKGKFVEFDKNALIRSAITLKLMQYYPTGALVAAPTTSLPETIGGVRNWDYRYVWIRDATFTIFAFYVLGYYDEAKKFFNYIENIASQYGKKEIDMEPLYTIHGKLIPREHFLEYFSGHKNSKPVRIGNAAAKQFQLDVYGTLIDAYYFTLKRGIRITKGAKKIILDLTEKIEQKWKQEGNGIWEIPLDRQQYTYSRVMAWVGINRALRLSNKLKISKERINKLIALEIEIKEWIWHNCFDKNKNSFVQYPGSKYQDATNFLFVSLHFLDRHEPMTDLIIENTRKELASSIFVDRYKSYDGIKGKEGAFVLCTFWMISSLAMLEKIPEAEALYYKAKRLFNQNGLMSEEIHPKTFEFLGNFPQAFSHLGHILCAYYLFRYKKISKYPTA